MLLIVGGHRPLLRCELQIKEWHKMLVRELKDVLKKEHVVKVESAQKMRTFVLKIELELVQNVGGMGTTNCKLKMNRFPAHIC